MNCDRVFDILTRGPFPTGTSIDATVEAHLVRCPGCRRLASALQPSGGRTQEALADDESRTLPGYWGELFVPAPRQRAGGGTRQLRRAVPVRSGGRRSAPRRRRAPSNVWRFVAAMIVGIAFGLAVHTDALRRTAVERAENAPPAIAPAAAQELQNPPAQAAAFGFTTACRQARILGLGLPSLLSNLRGAGGDDGHAAAFFERSKGKQIAVAALAEDAVSSDPAAALDQVGCCLECHGAAGAARVTAAARGKLAASCTGCHRP